VLARRYGRELLIDRAAAVDLGFDLAQLAGMIAMLDRYTDDDLPIPAEDAQPSATTSATGAAL
jgi:hypothetical protein